MPLFAKDSAPDPLPTLCTAFADGERIASGELLKVADAAKTQIDANPQLSLALFDDDTGRPVEIDFRGSREEVRARLERHQQLAAAPVATEVPRGPGRPRLGVVAREVTLLPRHWDWLSRQPGGASVALRKLVETARKTGSDRDRRRRSQEAAYRFMNAMAGNAPGFEEATRALFAGQAERFDSETAEWPADIRAHALRLAAEALATEK